MNNPAVAVLSLIITLLNFLPSTAFALTEADVLTNAGCTSSRQHRGYCPSIAATWKTVNGQGEARTCQERKLDLSSCCKDNVDEVSCASALKAGSGAASAAAVTKLLARPTNENIPGLAADGAATPALHSARTDEAKVQLASMRMRDRLAGMCKALAQTCKTKCVTDGEDSSPCTAGDDQAERMKNLADGNWNEASRIDPGLTAQDSRSGDNQGRGNGNQNGDGGNSNGGGGAPTQKAQPGGGGNPLMDMLKSAMQQQQQKPKPQDNSNATSQTCESNPNLAGCPEKVPDSDSLNKAQPKSDFQDTADKGAGGDKFNVGGEGIQPSAYTGNGAEPKFGTPASANAIPNGGGQIPGGAAAAPAAGAGAAGGMAQKAATDIMHGMMAGGGYSQMNAAMQMQNGGNGGFSGYGAQGTEGYKPGMDLRQFLPGGKNDPTRKLAGGASTFQIQPQTVNIWHRISERIRARCSQGMLRDCN